MNTTNHTQPIGEDAANGATVKPVASLVTFDEFVQYGKDHGANIVNGMPWSFVFNGHAVTHENDDLYLIGTPSIQFKRGELLVVTAFGEYRLLQVLQLPAANGAIGEREAWEQLRGLLAVAMCSFATKVGRKDLDAAVSVLDAITEPGSPIAWLRAALHAEKVTAEPVDFVFPPMPPAIVMHDKLGPLFDRLSMHFYAYKCMTIAAPQQPAQSAEQDEQAAFLSGRDVEELFLRWSEWTTELGEAISRKNIDGFVSDLRAILAAQPEIGGKS